jgi:anti-sigma B factor antagonist
MSPARVTMTVRIISPTTSIIGVDGELDAAAEAALMDAHMLATALTTHIIILDCNRLNSLTSSGVGLIVTLLIRMHRRRQHLIVFALSEHDASIFIVTRLSEAVAIYDTETAALAAAGEC